MIDVYTFGEFDIKIDGESVLPGIGSKHRLLKLFKYLLTFQGKKLLPENIIDDLWQDLDYKDPVKALRTQISRVRNLFNLEGRIFAPFFTISFIDGYYIFELDDNCNADFLCLQKCLEMNHIINGESLMACRKVMEIYKGVYLRELGDEGWIVPIRSKYDRLYVGSISRYLQYLKEGGQFVDTLEVSEEAMGYKPYEESFHISFMEALVKLGQWEYALEHYSYCTGKIYRELGESPSKNMKDIYRKIKCNHSGEDIVDCDCFGFDSEDSEGEGMLLCEKSDFLSLCSFEARLKERVHNNAYLGVLTIGKSGLQNNHNDEIRLGMQSLQSFMKKGLRKGDVLSQWNDKQLLVLFHSLSEDDIDIVLGRIRNSFNKVVNGNYLDLNIKLKKI